MKIIEVKNQIDGGRAAFAILSDKLKEGAQVLGLATGSTPITLYQEILASNLDFSQMVSINLDEYVGLSPHNPQSYHHFMEEHLFQHKPFKKSFLPDGEAVDLSLACQEYDSILADHPIDLQILGIGSNGHIGFNEPGTAFSSRTHLVDLDASTISANARFFEHVSEVPRRALSMGLASIMSAKSILLLAYGESKAAAVAAMLSGPVTEALPASILQKHPEVYLIADVEALSQYKKQ